MNTSCPRRTVLRSLPVALAGVLSGCSTITGMFTGPPPDVVVFNRTNGTITVSIEISEQDSGNTVVSETADISSDSAAEYPDALEASGDYVMTVETNGGLSGNYEWSVSSDEQSMQVRINSDSIRFDRVSP